MFYAIFLSPVRTAVPFWRQSSQFPSSFPPKRDCGPQRVNQVCTLSYESPPLPHCLTSVWWVSRKKHLIWPSLGILRWQRPWLTLSMDCFYTGFSAATDAGHICEPNVLKSLQKTEPLVLINDRLFPIRGSVLVNEKIRRSKHLDDIIIYMMCIGLTAGNSLRCLSPESE